MIASANAARGQEGVAKVVNLDAFTVSARTEGFEVNDFIRKVREDTTFYKAFLNMRYFPHKKKGHITVFEKDASEKGTMDRTAVQYLSTDEVMHLEITFEETNGRIRKRNGDWRYLTAEMYDDIFFPEGPQRVSNRIVTKEQELVSGSRIDKHKAQLKRLMFNPGAEIGNVPFIGDKMAIFDDHMVPYYDYAIYNDLIDGEETIAFSCVTKPSSEDDTVIRELTSWFHPDTYEVVKREYRLAHNTLLFSFDISTLVINTRREGHLLPRKILYRGQWNALFRKPEIIDFSLFCDEYILRAGSYTD